MNLLFPSKTEALIAANRLIHPDAVLRKLRRLSLIGAIRQRNGFWEAAPRPKDDPWDAPVNSMPGPEKRLIKCKVCGRDTYHTKYCCLACKNRGMSKPLPKCLLCSNTVKNHKRTFCSKACRDKAQIGNHLRMRGGKRVMINLVLPK